MNIRCLRHADDAIVITMAVVASILVLIVGIILILVVTGLVFGIFTLIGMCLLAGSAFILLMKKGAVAFTPNSPFMWLLIIGLIMLVFGQVVMDIGSFDLSVIPGLEAFHDSIHIDGGGEI